MGCANSKPKECHHCHCNGPYFSSMPRSYSVHVHHPPQSKGDSYHVVALTSTTLGSLDQVTHNNNGLKFPNGKANDGGSLRNKKKLEDEVKEAKSWSQMIEQMLPKSMPKTPTITPPNEPETINTWELMEGLEDTSTSPFRSPKHFKSFSFDVNLNGHVDDQAKPIENEAEKGSSPNDSDQLYFVSSSFKKSLQEKQESMAREGLFSFEEKKTSGDAVLVDLFRPWVKDKVVFYFTSLRGVRKTYEDCCNVRLILKGLGVRVDERDVSMHSGFKEELKELLGHGYSKGTLPRVFIGRNYIGGAEEIQQLHEEGKLEKLLDRCEKIDANDVCEACGDIRFVPCETCYGSCKIYYEGHEDEEEQDEDGEYGLQRCPDCNENGLIRCPLCCY